MAQQSGGFGKVVLWVVLGVVGIIVVGTVLGWLLSALWNIFLGVLVVGAIAVVSLLVVGAVRRSVGGSNRRQLPR